MRTVIITFNTSENTYNVIEGDRICDRLCWEEMLGQIATMTHPDIRGPRFPMVNREEIVSRATRRMAKFIEDLAPSAFTDEIRERVDNYLPLA
jgi:hypothetical protein